MTSAALQWNLISVEDYLAGELISPIKHEYLGGVVVNQGLDVILNLAEIGIELPLAEIFDGVELSPEPGSDETA